MADVAAGELRRRASELRSKAQRLERCCAEETALAEDLEAKLSALQGQSAAAETVREELRALLEKTAGSVRSLSKQQLDEVRSLTSPPTVVRRTLALVYCLLNPEVGSKIEKLDDVPWKQRLSPMLKRDDLVRKLASYPPPDVQHPLLAFPAIAELVQQSVVIPEPTEKSSEQTPKGSKTPASGNAARLLRSKTSVLNDSPSPNGRSSLVRKSSLTDTIAGMGSRRNSAGAAALLGEDARLTVEAVTFASQAVGALFRWVLAQFRYAKAVESATAEVPADEVEQLKDLTDEASATAVAQRSKAESVAQEASTAARLANESETAAQAAEDRLRNAPVVPTPPEPEEEVVDAEEAEASLSGSVSRGAVSLSAVEVEVRERVTFGNGSSAMSSFATRALHGVIGVMNENEGLMICVEGHCRPGEAEALSSERANRVLEELVRQGVPRHRLRAAGFGSSFADGEASAGRVEFSVIQEISIKGTVQFSPCSDQLSRASEPLLQGVTALLLARPCLRVRVEGHTDSSPNWGCTNLELAEGRARSVVSALEQAGIGENRLVPVGFGEKLPKAPNSSSEGKAKNRRVEFHILQRETVQGLQQLLHGPRKGAIDESGLRQLVRTATGAGNANLALPIRRAAADVLRRLGADWKIQRLMHLAVRQDPSSCPLAMLPDDCLRRVLQFYFLLGCFQP